MTDADTISKRYSRWFDAIMAGDTTAVGDDAVDGHLDTGTRLRSHARFSGLWRHDGTGWRCHAHHSTSITPP